MIMMLLLTTMSQTAHASDSGWGEIEQVEVPVHDVMLYGFIDSYWEIVAPAPEAVNEQGETEYGTTGYEFDLPNVNVMVQGSLHQKYRYFLNLAGPGSGSSVDDSPLVIRNAWVEAPIKGQMLAVRAGKLYRRFGLYNEILDAVPTFIGIEPPELFDKDHLMLTRTTNLMVFGSAAIAPSTRLHYSASTGNEERTGNAVPLGLDVHVGSDVFRGGSSFYTSGGDAAPSRAVGDGSPRGGVANWMTDDRYMIYGGYAEVTPGGLTLQAEFWRAAHNATRDPDAVAQLADGGLNPAQLDRFYINGDPTQGTTPNKVSYTAQTGYFRGGYRVNTGKTSSVTPYVQADWYSNPELVASKDLGGDGEAGVADDGSFLKYTAGSVIRPVPEVALKIDGSAHQLKFNDRTELYPELRVSFSYQWQLKVR